MIANGTDRAAEIASEMVVKIEIIVVRKKSPTSAVKVAIRILNTCAIMLIPYNALHQRRSFAVSDCICLLCGIWI
jgi:hypothetical protein